jgi:glutaredoxin 3
MVFMMIIYTKTGCPWCEDVLEYLNENNIKYEERNVISNPVYFKELFSKSGQGKCPTLDLDGKILPDAGVEEVRTFLVENKII